MKKIRKQEKDFLIASPRNLGMMYSISIPASMQKKVEIKKDGYYLNDVFLRKKDEIIGDDIKILKEIISFYINRNFNKVDGAKEMQTNIKKAMNCNEWGEHLICKRFLRDCNCSKLY